MDGKKIAERVLSELREEVFRLKKTTRLAVVAVGENPVIEHFIEQKRKRGESIGIDIRIYRFEEKIATNSFRKRLVEITHEKKNTGVIVQLPLPEHISAQYILNSIPPGKDVDVLSARSLGNFYVGKSEVLPPVVGAVKTFFEEYGIEYIGKNIVVVGTGRLVGKPIASWLMNENATVSVVNEHTKDIAAFTSKADIIISGAGKPGLVKGDMIKEGAVVIDAGASESEGKMVGDVDFDSVSAKASHITPVPGGVGPLTVAVLLRNLVTLAKKA